MNFFSGLQKIKKALSEEEIQRQDQSSKFLGLEVKTIKDELDEVSILTQEFTSSLPEEKVEDGFVSNTQGVSLANSKENSEIYQDSLKMMEHGTDVSKSEMLSTLAAFGSRKLPSFKDKKVQCVRASVWFQGAYISKVATKELNDKFNYDIEWRGGFLVGYNVPILAIRYWSYKNKDTHYTDIVKEFCKKFSRRKGKQFYVTDSGKFQLLSGYACKPMFPQIEGVVIGSKYRWKFIGG
jgi:hypothetical protein